MNRIQVKYHQYVCDKNLLAYAHATRAIINMVDLHSIFPPHSKSKHYSLSYTYEIEKISKKTATKIEYFIKNLRILLKTCIFAGFCVIFICLNHT